jgi:hypothetical protein
MPQWEGIEDASACNAAVWLQQRFASSSDAATKKTREWRPLRKSDCQKLNETTITPTTEVLVEGGRATAKPGQGKLSYNFLKGRAAEQALDYATWFVVQEEKKQTDNKEVLSHLQPIFHKQDSEAIEALYQSAIQASSTLGKGIASVLKDEVLLSDETTVKVVKQADGRLSLKKTPKGSWQLFSNSSLLQRGYGEYHVPGEDTELLLGPVRHLVFVVHGIGEALFSREDVTQFPSLVETLHQTRASIQEKQVAEWRRHPDQPPPSRIEFVPIEWFDELHDSSSSLMKSLRAATLPSIPALRAIANDVIFDVLMVRTPSTLYFSFVLIISFLSQPSLPTKTEVHDTKFLPRRAGMCDTANQ